MKEIKSKQKNKFFTTRPKLACYLLRLGYEGGITLNPYDPSRPAWEFEKTNALEESVETYFREEMSK